MMKRDVMREIRLRRMETALLSRLYFSPFPALLLLVFSAAGCLIGREQMPKPGTDAGRVQFEAYCAACHQPDGSGGVGGGPPLAESSWVRGPESRLIRIVLHGLRGPIEVAGETYDREMLSFGQVISDEQIASLLTYVRSRWGRIDRPVTAEQVRQIRRASADRSGYWTVEELLEMP